MTPKIIRWVIPPDWAVNPRARYSIKVLRVDEEETVLQLVEDLTQVGPSK